jgi:hypothetical protein
MAASDPLQLAAYPPKQTCLLLGHMKTLFHIGIFPIIAGLIMMPSVIYAESAPSTPEPTQIEQQINCREIICRGTSGVKHSFFVKVKDGISSIIEKVKSKITGNGGKFEGNLEHGVFGGRSAFGTIKGEYITISDNEIEIVITDKPFIVPYKTIEYRVREYLN